MLKKKKKKKNETCECTPRLRSVQVVRRTLVDGLFHEAASTAMATLSGGVTGGVSWAGLDAHGYLIAVLRVLISYYCALLSNVD